jgi:hypothetical protein
MTINESRKAKMLDMRASRMTFEAIGKEFGITRERVSQIIGRGRLPKKERVYKTPNVITRFFQFVTLPGNEQDINFENLDFDSCWIWHGSKAGIGYGTIKYPPCKQCYAHRFSYQLFNGPIPNGLDVCHSCDNPLCVNPAHLWAGTAKDNTHDSIKKGRFKPFGHSYKHSIT